MKVSEFLPQLHYPSRAERIADGWVHAIGLVFASLGAATILGLAIWQGGIGEVSAIVIYSVCMLIMLGCSAAYNLAEKAKRKSLLRRFDHAAIFLMIAGTYTPFTTLRLEGAWSLWMTAAVWTLAGLGVIGKLFLPGVSKKVWVVFYVLLGWLIIAAIGPMTESVSLAALILLAVGGVIYTLGVPIYVRQTIPYRRAIWHGFVLTAVCVHYAAVLTGVVFA